MNALTTEIKTHVVKFKDTDECIYVTDEMAKKLSYFRRSPNSVSFPLLDSTTGRLIRDIGKYEITSISEIKKEAISNSDGMKWICDYGVRHNMHEKECDCKEVYRSPEMGITHYLRFQEWAKKRFPNQKIHYSGDITDRMRQEFLKEKSLI